MRIASKVAVAPAVISIPISNARLICPPNDIGVQLRAPDNIGLEAIDDGLWNILYYNTLLGRLSERTGKISGASFRSDEC